MKAKIIVFFIFQTSLLFGQSVISSVNSGAVSNNNMMFSVGEIFVIPSTNTDDSNSGLMGILYQVELNLTGIDEVFSSDNVKLFPNPTDGLIYLSSDSSVKIEYFYIYNIEGRLVASFKNNENALDLSGYPSGIYYLKTNLENIKSLKIIKY